MATLVPNVFPKILHPTFKLAIVGEAPGVEEEVIRTPFVGSSGRLLRHLLGANNISAEQCFIGNVTQYRPPDNDINAWAFEGPEIQEGLAQLRTDLHSFNPNCTLLLGATPLRAFCPQHASSDDKGNLSWSISNYRGSILSGALSGLLPDARSKVIPAYHPAYILRSYGEIPFLKFDIQRAVKQSAFPDIKGTARAITTRPTLSEVLEVIGTIRTFKRETAFDVEGWNDNVGITMCSIATSPTQCLVIPFFLNGQHYWHEDEEATVWGALAGWLSDASCGKRVTNATYEQFILAWKHNIIINGITEDTMFKTWEIFPELEKSLAIQASIYTEEPYYKHERHSDSEDGKLLYNGKDSCVTFEASDAQETVLRKSSTSNAHYRFNINLLPAVQYIMLRGCRFDVLRAAEHKLKAEADLQELQQKISDTLKREFNVKSPLDKKWLLYEYFGYKPYARVGETTKEEVMRRYYARDREPILKTVIDAVGLRTRISDIAKLTLDFDGRIRSNYNLVGTDTGRLSSSSSNSMVPYFTKSGLLKWDQTGTNLQNVTKELRDCFIPDSPDHFFFQCDLSGADGWTVAADLAALGSNTMLDDYLVGIKPAKVLLLMLAEYEAKRDPAAINKLDRSELKRLTKALKFPEGRDEHGRPGDWLYLCMKRVQHGCVTGGHEVLTQFGWKEISQLKQGEVILTYDEKSRTAFWDVPSKLTNFAYDGDLYTFKGTSYDLEVTHDHRVLFETNNSFKVTNAADMAMRVSGKLPTTADGYFVNNEQPSELFMQQLAAYQADGYMINSKTIGFHLKRPRKIERLLKLFGQPTNFRDDKKNIEAVYYEYTRPDLAILKITDWGMLRYNSSSLYTYITESLLWDGSVQIEENHKRQEITTAEIQRADVLNTIARLCGFGSQLTYNARLSGFGTWMHSVSLNARKMANRNTMVVTKRKSENDQVYCVTVSTGFFFVRRNQKVMITGNSNYGMEPDKLSATIFKDSDGLIDLTTKQAGIYQYLYKLRYNPKLRNDWITRQLSETGSLHSAAGITRRFFGLRNPRQPDADVVRSALAFEPQANTTFAANLALHGLWYDPSNRTSRSSLFVEPLLQIHDALAGQFKRSYAAWAVERLKAWFDTELIIHGIKVKIPFEGGYGPNWLNTKEMEF